MQRRLDPHICERRAEEVRIRARIYAFLADVFREPLRLTALRAITSDRFMAALAEAGVELGDGFKNIPESELLDELAVDYTQLFHGPRTHVPPYESVQAGGEIRTLNGEAAVRVRRFLEANGLLLKETCHELPDHLSVELEAMAVLLEREAEALDRRDLMEAEQWAEQWRLFLEGHLGAWMPDFGRQIAQLAESVFYRELGRLLTDYIERELVRLENPPRAPFTRKLRGSRRTTRLPARNT